MNRTTKSSELSVIEQKVLQKSNSFFFANPETLWRFSKKREYAALYGQDQAQTKDNRLTLFLRENLSTKLMFTKKL